MLTFIQVIILICITQVIVLLHIYISNKTSLRSVTPPNGGVNNKDINTNNINTSNTSNISNAVEERVEERVKERVEELVEERVEEVEKEEIINKFDAFDKRINILKDEINSNEKNNNIDFVVPGEVYDIPDDYSPTGIYEEYNTDVEIILPEYEKYMEDKMRIGI